MFSTNPVGHDGGGGCGCAVGKRGGVRGGWGGGGGGFRHPDSLDRLSTVSHCWVSWVPENGADCVGRITGHLVRSCRLGPGDSCPRVGTLFTTPRGITRTQ